MATAQVRETVTVDQDYSGGVSPNWTELDNSVGAWTNGGFYTYCTGGAVEGSHRYLARDMGYPYGSVESLYYITINNGLFIAGPTSHSGEPDAGVYFSMELEPGTSNYRMLLELKGMTNLAQTDYGYGFRSEALVPASIRDSTSVRLRLTLKYNEAWVEDASTGQVYIRLTFGNHLAAEVKASIENGTRGGYFTTSTGISTAIWDLKVTEVNTRRQLMHTGAPGSNVEFYDQFSRAENPWNPDNTVNTPFSNNWTVYMAQTGQLYLSSNRLNIISDTQAGTRYNVAYCSQENANYYDTFWIAYWRHYTAGYSVGFQAATTMRVAVNADVNSGQFYNWHRAG